MEGRLVTLERAGNEMELRAVERYIFARKKRTPFNSQSQVKEIFLQTGVLCSLVALAFMYIGLRQFVAHTEIEMSAWLTAIIAVLLISLVAAIAIMKHKKEFEKSKSMTDEEVQRKFAKKGEPPWRTAISTVVFILAIMAVGNFLRNQHPDLYPYISFLAIITCVSAMQLQYSHNFFRVYLINKYCPYLKTPADTRYYKADVHVVTRRMI